MVFLTENESEEKNLTKEELLLMALGINLKAVDIQKEEL